VTRHLIGVNGPHINTTLVGQRLRTLMLEGLVRSERDPNGVSHYWQPVTA
jgi:hypothetical protein